MKKALSIVVCSAFLFLTACTGPATSTATTQSTPAPVASTGEQASSQAKSEAPAQESSFVLPTGDFTLPTTGIGPTITTDLKADGDYTIACIVKNSTNPYMVSQLAGVTKAGEDMGFEAITMAPAKQDSVEEQVKIIEDMIQKQVDGIIVHCADSNGITPGIRKAEEAGIPVVTIGTPGSAPTMLRTGVNYEETGYEVAKYLAEKVEGKGNVIILEGPPGAQNAKERLAGIQRALEEYPDMTILASQTANFKRTEGMSVTENLLQKHKEVDILIGCNDESALGGIQALKAAGMDSVLVGGFDGSVDAASSIKSGEMAVSYNTDPFGSGYLAAAYIVGFLNDGSLPPSNFVPFPSSKDSPLITSENVEDYIAEKAWWNAN